MNWLVFSYSLPSKSSSPRVSVWRQLKRVGAISPVSGAYILPDNDACTETFNWLAQQVRQAKWTSIGDGGRKVPRPH